MNDLEDLVREELRSRADAADADHPAEPAAALLGGLDRRIRVARLRRRWTAAALSGAAIAAAVTLPIALLSPGPAGPSGPVRPRAGLPLTDTAATPFGWAPIAHGDAQISVPWEWRVVTRLECGRAGRPGYVVLGGASTKLAVTNPRCRQTPNMAAILTLQRPSAPGGATLGSRVINGIKVWRVPSPRGSISYVAPRLSVQVTARGPLASRVLATLTRSPGSVVFAPGRESPVPRSWLWHDFGGIRFAAPPEWRLEHPGFRYGCPGELAPGAVKLITANKVLAVSCADGSFMAGSMTALPGVAVVTGRFAVLDAPRGSPCHRLHGLRACYSSPMYLGGVLDMSIFVPGRPRPTVVKIGLAGNGLIARTIFDSIRPG